MDDLQRNIILSVFLIVLLYALGFVFYHYFEGWDLVDSIYFQTMTFTTIGYGDIVPETDEGKIFTIFISWVGISIAFFVLYSLSAYREQVLDRKINNLLFHQKKYGRGSHKPRLPRVLRKKRKRHGESR